MLISISWCKIIVHVLKVLQLYSFPSSLLEQILSGNLVYTKSLELSTVSFSNVPDCMWNFMLPEREIS